MEAGDFEGISVAFAMGVAVAAAAPLHGGGYFVPALAASALCAPAAGFCRPGRNAATALLLYLILGILVYSGSALGSPSASHIPLTDIFSGAARAVSLRIDAAGFKGSDTAPLLKALLLGDRSSLPIATVKAFRGAGASHILALSGFHLGIIYLLLSKLLSLTGNFPRIRALRSISIICACTFYTLATGASPSLVRALLFIIFNEIRKFLPGRRGSPASALCTALTLQLLFSPQSIHSTGFQLSYLAMTGIIVIYPRLRNWYRSAGGPMGFIWNSAAMSLSCQVFTAPLVLLKFGTFPRYFLITNLLALPLTEALVFSALACLALGGYGHLAALTDLLCSLLVSSLQIISTM